MNKILQSLIKHPHVTKLPDLDAVTRYVKANIVRVQKGTKCVDGRYLPSQAHGMLARPGADGGYVMVLEAVNRKKNLGLSPKQCFNVVFKAVKKLNGIFYLHTDEYASAHNGFIGCGHLAKAARRGLSWEYDIRSRDVRDMVDYAKNLCEVTPNIEIVKLAGNHEEKGVLIIHSDQYTVLADNPKQHQMYFIYDVDRDHAFLKALVCEMALAEVTFKDMLHEANLQLDATLQNLAVRLPVYDVHFSGERPEVTYIDHIKQKPFLSRMHVPFNSSFIFALRHQR